MSSTVALPDSRAEILQKADTESTVKAATATAALTAAGVTGRVALQWNPSLETVLPFAVAAGFYGGFKHGFASGVAGFFATNFLIWGGQGPWTIFQCLGAGIGAGSAAFFGNISQSFKSFATALITATLVFEIAVNSGSLFYMPFGLTSMATALPFIAVHFASSLSFGSIIYGNKKILSKVYGQH